MLINPTIDPYSIIKASFYQSTNPKKMEALFEDKKEEIKFRGSQDPDSFIFDNDFIKLEEKRLEELKIKIFPSKEQAIFHEHTRILYIKITNFIIINILYNRTFDKYLLYSIGLHDLSNKVYRKQMIPEKVNEILNDFNFDDNKLTANTILSVIKTGKNFNDVNSLILNKKPIYIGGSSNNNDYYQKYLKYKNKYLKLKNYL